jgi:4-hydroxyphenylacetate 3-hydroxylase, reductase component
MSDSEKHLDGHIGDPRRDQKGYRRCLSQFGTGVTVITGASGEGKFGVTCNSFSSLSLEPPLILWSLRHASKHLALFQNSERFAVNVLSESQNDIASIFAGSENDKFSNIDWLPNEWGIPLLDGACARFECCMHDQFQGGDHDIFVGRVERFSTFHKVPLLYVQGQYAMAAPIPAEANSIQPQGKRAASADIPLLHLLFKAYYLSAAKMEDIRHAVSITQIQGRILNCLHHSGNCDVGSICDEMYITPEHTQDALADLLEQGLVVRSSQDPDQYSLTLAGTEKWIRLRKRAVESEQFRFSDIPKSDMVTLRRELEHLS